MLSLFTFFPQLYHIERASMKEDHIIELAVEQQSFQLFGCGERSKDRLSLKCKYSSLDWFLSSSQIVVVNVL